VTDHAETHVTELFHQLDQCRRHRAFGVRRVILVGFGDFAPAVAGKIGQDQFEFLRERRRDPVIFDMRLRKSVDQEQRGTFAAGARE
jgi:hypothetical protein